MPACAATRKHCSGLHAGPDNEPALGRLRTLQGSAEIKAIRSAVISLATYSGSGLFVLEVNNLFVVTVIVVVVIVMVMLHDMDGNRM